MKLVALLAVLALGLAAAGCSDDNGTDSGTQGTTTEAVPPVAGETIPDPRLIGTLDQGYKTDADGVQSVPSPDELPVSPGSIQAWWYHTAKRFVVVYAGFSLADNDPLCAGTSILIGPGFENVSNSPTAEGGCTGRLTDHLTGENAGVRACGSLLVYLTKIPWGSQGVVYASLETLKEGTVYGVTSAVDTTVAEAPRMELSETGYIVPSGTLPDGSTQVTC